MPFKSASRSPFRRTAGQRSWGSDLRRSAALSVSGLGSPWDSGLEPRRRWRRLCLCPVRGPGKHCLTSLSPRRELLGSMKSGITGWLRGEREDLDVLGLLTRPPRDSPAPRRLALPTCSLAHGAPESPDFQRMLRPPSWDLGATVRHPSSHPTPVPARLPWEMSMVVFLESPGLVRLRRVTRRPSPLASCSSDGAGARARRLPPSAWNGR